MSSIKRWWWKASGRKWILFFKFWQRANRNLFKKTIETLLSPLDLILIYLLWYSDCQKGAYYHRAVHLIMQGGAGGRECCSQQEPKQRPTPGAVLQPCMATTTKNFLSAYFSPYMVRHPIRFSFVPLQAVHHVGCGRFEFRWGAECQIFRLLRMTTPSYP